MHCSQPPSNHRRTKMWPLNATHLWVLLFVGVVTAIYFFIERRFSFWPRLGVPFKKPHWFFGNFGDVIRRKVCSAEVSADLYKHFKGARFGGVWEFFSPKLFVMDPELVRNIFVKDFSTWSSRGMAVNFDAEPISEHLVTLDGRKWKSVRAKLTPTFTSSKLKRMHHLLLECGMELEKYLEDLATNDGLVEAREMSARFTTDVIGSCVFGIQMNALGDEGSTFRKMGKRIFQPSLRQKIVRAIQRGFTPLFRLLKLVIHEREVTDFFLKITKESLEYRERNNVQRNDFIDLLRDLKNTGKTLDEDEIEFDDKLLAAQAFVFFAAGFETSSTAISFCLFELAANQEIQDRLREEIHETKKTTEDGEISWDALKNMKYLDMVVQETLRKYPPIPLIARFSTKPYTIPETKIELPAAMACLIPVYALHHDPKFYPEPEKFDPERFTDDAKNRRPAFAFLPFGGGPRICIGLRFAEQQTKLALVKMVDKFNISLSEKSQNPLQLHPGARFLVPKDGIWVRVSKISSN